MKMKIVIGCVALFFVVACDLSGVKKNAVNLSDDANAIQDDAMTNKEKVAPASVLDSAVMEKSYDNGIKIKWFKKGEGPQIRPNDMVKIDFRNKLEDGTIYDGNHLIQKVSIPFFLGWNLQTEGWELALPELRVGDEVDVFIPASLARGEKGVEGIVPPNANNILSLRVLDVIEPDFLQDGIRIWRVEEAKIEKREIHHSSQVSIHYWVSTKDSPRFDNSYKRGQPFDLKMGDGNIVPGLYKALLYGRTGDKLMVHIPAVEAYGSKGLPGLVKPNQDLFYDLIILDVK